MSLLIVGSATLTVPDPCSAEPTGGGGSSSSSGASRPEFCCASKPRPTKNGCGCGTSTCSANPVRYFTGEPVLERDDLPGANGYGLPWGQTSSFAGQLKGDYNLGQGQNWQSGEWCHLALVFDDTTYNEGGLASRVFRRANQTPVFEKGGTGYEGNFDRLDRLTFDPDTKRYIHRQTDGSETEFIALTAMFVKHTDARGNAIEIIEHAANGFNFTKVERTCQTPTGAVVETYDYEYDDEASHDPHVTKVTLSRTTGSVSRVQYTYYGEDDPHGLPGDLRTAETEVWQGADWESLGTTYYRYYTGEVAQSSSSSASSESSSSSSSGGGVTPPAGQPHLVKFAVLPASFDRLSADPFVDDPFTAGDGVVSLYADNYFEYDGERRVTRESVQGGSRTFQFEYAESGFDDDYNAWNIRTTETFPDDSQNVIYSNYAGQTMLKVFRSDDGEWCEFIRYDAKGREILFANPSAVAGYDEGEPTLVMLRLDEGLIRTQTYHEPSDNVSSESVQQGEAGTPILLREYDYCCYDDGGCECGGSSSSSGASGSGGGGGSGSGCDSGVWFLSRLTEYPDADDPDHTLVTTYCRTFHGGGYGVKELVTTLPVVPTGQNGSGIAAVWRDVFDRYGNPTWSMDERGFLTHMVYDVPTGALVQTVNDADTAQSEDVPNGWTTPLGGGQHLVTDHEHDGQGRVTQTLGPAFTGIPATSGGGSEPPASSTLRTATWTVYRDAQHITLSAGGFVDQGNGDQAMLVNPVSITKADAGGKVLEQIQAVSELTEGSLPDILAEYAEDDRCGEDPTFGAPPLCGLPQSQYVRWSTNQYTDCCLAASQRVYHTIPTDGEGDEGTNYDQTHFGYDVMKRRVRTVSPGGTISWTVFDSRGQVIETYIGTDDTGATETDPTGGGATGNNMVLVAENEYDADLPGGDGNLTTATQHVDATTIRVTEFLYDFRNRRTDIDGELDFYQRDYHDNLDRVVQTDRYDTVAPSEEGGGSSSSSSGSTVGNLIARSESFYDDRGRVYQTIRYGVDPATGEVGNSLVDNTWYDDAGNVIKQLPAGAKLFTKSEYDGLHRPFRRYVGLGDDATYDDVMYVDDDTILEQVETFFDTAGHAVAVVSSQRYQDATGEGPLNGPDGTQPKSRRTYSASWIDGVGRTIATANYGTNGGEELDRPDDIPEPSDTVLVSAVQFDDAGMLLATTDPSGMVTRIEYDDLGRKMSVIENYVESSSSSGSGSGGSCAASDDTNRTMQFTYTADGQVATLTAINSATSDQVTTYTYGTTLADSDIATSNLLRRVQYPDSTGTSDSMEATYNRQGQRKTARDQNGTVHSYDYDALGRITHDRVTTLGTNVDGAVRRLTTSYEVRGMAEKLTSYNNATIGSGSVVNEVQFEFNDFGQIVGDYQSHAGAVNVSTTPMVGYAYEDGSANTIRPTTLIYPDGREFAYGYGDIDSVDDQASRVRDLSDGSGVLAQYEYLGLGSSVIVEYPEPQVRYTLVGTVGGNDPDTGDIYRGLDRFGRVKDSYWFNYDSDTDVDRIKYGYDRASNRIWRENTVATALSQEFDELYTYDGLQRLKDMQRGTLNGGHTAISSPTFAQCWSLDPTGNWQGFKEADSGSSWTLDQSRSANEVNEITAVTNTTGPTWATPAYSPAGNMTTIPKPADPTESFTATYDAWNRLVTLIDDDTDDTVQENEYDPRGFRTIRKDYTAGTLSEVRQFFYNSGWQCLEEQIDSATDPNRQFVWGLRYIDDLVCRDRDTDDDGSLDERLYGLQDANWNVTTVYDTASEVLERLSYDAYGKTTFLNSDFTEKLSTSIEWETTYCGYRWDAISGLFKVRHRDYHTTLGLWTTQDLIGYVDGMNLYGAYFVPSGVDPFGLWTWRLSSTGSILACAEPGDTLRTLAQMGYSQDKLQSASATSCGCGSLDDPVKTGCCIDVSFVVPPRVAACLQQQQSKSVDSSFVNHKLGFSGYPKSVITRIQNKMPCTYGDILDDLVTSECESMGSIVDFGQTQCYGFLALCRETLPDYGQAVSPINIFLNIYGPGFATGSISYGVKTRSPGGFGPLIHLGNAPDTINYTPATCSTLDMLVMENSKAIDNPLLGDTCLFKDNDGIGHCGFVLGSSRGGTPYLLQKLNNNQPCCILPANSRITSRFGDPEYHSGK